MIRALSARGILIGTVDSAKLPALMAATGAGTFYGPGGLGQLGGGPAEQRLYPPLRSRADAEHIWRISEELTKTTLPTA
ncbi:hypothetical protein ACWGID_03465 [Kribbella sp. NPDC054772]